MTIRQDAHVKLRNWIDASKLSQSDIAFLLGVSRAAVSRWCDGSLRPSEQRAKRLEQISGGDILSTDWPRPRLHPAPTPGGRVLQTAALQSGLSFHRFAIENRLPHRAFMRWVKGQSAPRDLTQLNRALDLKLNREDFEVLA